MKALVKYSLDGPGIEIRDVPEPALRPGTVLVATRAVGVCGSDVHLWRNAHSWEVTLPVVMGHEIAGEIAGLGEGVIGWSIGDRVVCETAGSICGRCAYCRSGRYNMCPHRLGYGARHDGFFTEHVVVEPRILHRIPDSVPFEIAAMTEPFAVAFNGLVERGNVRPGDHVLIQGAGAIGALSAQIARLRGAATITVACTDRDSLRLEALRGLGVDTIINTQREDVLAHVASLGDGLGSDVVVDATGASAALRLSLDAVRPGGIIVKVGWGPQPLNFSLDPLVAKAATLLGSFSHTWGTWERVLALLALGRFDSGAVLGGTYPLGDWEQAFGDMETGRNIKSVMVFGG
ncbi:MAG: zinc-binding dehydrogenase [Bifidobacteriaceae bacterium]|jgi:alcohol dehydrogenase/L-iditol 2-dehydrogenase|nr:zinc-binding dehydrogenase [Bifidobacteriaceae bacterium]